MEPSQIAFLILLIGAGVFFYVWTEKMGKAKEQRAQIRAEEQRPHVEERLADIEAGGTIDELDPRIKFRSQTGETIFAAIPCYREQLKSETTGVTYGGPVIRFKLAQGVYIRAAHYRGTKHKEDVLRTLGMGYLVVTNKRLVFVAQDDGGNWVRRWSSVISWQVEGSMLVVEGTSGRPMLFDMDVQTVQPIPIEYIDANPVVLNRILGIASGQEPARNV